MDRREELTDQALDYVLEHGLVGLSLRPLAAALGTSDRMLLYYFGTKERLVDDVLGRAQSRLALSLEGASVSIDSLGELVPALWGLLTSPEAAQVTRLYLDTCTLAVQDPRLWGRAPERLRAPWRAPLQQALIDFGVASTDAVALADLVLGTLDGLALHQMVSPEPQTVDAAAAAFGRLLAAHGEDLSSSAS